MLAPMAHVRTASDSQNSLIRNPATSPTHFRMSLAMKTNRLLCALCSAAYPLVSLAAALAAGLCLSTPVLAQEAAPTLAAPPLLSYAFSQDGYDGGALLSGTFAGRDLDGDGMLFGYEISQFSLSFSGNAEVGSFSHTKRQLNGIEYLIGSSVIGDIEIGGLASNTSGYSGFSFGSFQWPDYSIAGVVTNLDTGAFTQTDHLIQVTPVPEPGTWALMLAGLGVCVVLGRRRRGR
jgi:hypothetical protein